jgi:predicted amidohydrolase YtcJ
VIAGQVMIAAATRELEVADAVGLANGRVVDAGRRDEVIARAAPDADVVDAGAQAVVPGLHDFHLHLVGMARARMEMQLDDAVTPEVMVQRVTDGAATARPDTWLRGRGWPESAFDVATPARLADALAGRPALLYSHDTHSAWASPAAMQRAGLDADTPDPAGGRLERDAAGRLNGILRERATDLVERVAERAGGDEVLTALDGVVSELAAWGVTSVTDAGDTTADNGTGRYAVLGDRASLLLTAAQRLDGRLRAWIGFPAAAMKDAARLGIRSGDGVPGTRTMRFGWAKAYLDGALGSRTAALFEPYECGEHADAGIVRLSPDELDRLLATAHASGISMAMHAIGDAAVAAALDALERAGERRGDGLPHRIEHLQLLRASDVPRLAALGVAASVQPVHCAADRPAMEACWSSRLERAYPWRSMLDAGVLLASGSDAPIESPNPWLAIHAAVHRSNPGDVADWQPAQALKPWEALRAATLGAAQASGRTAIGHLRPGARADLAVLNVPLETILAADERLAGVRSELTIVDGTVVHQS